MEAAQPPAEKHVREETAEDESAAKKMRTEGDVPAAPAAAETETAAAAGAGTQLDTTRVPEVRGPTPRWHTMHSRPDPPTVPSLTSLLSLSFQASFETNTLE